MSEKLYEITAQYQSAFNNITDALADSEFTDDEIATVIRDSLVGLQDKFEDKALAVGKYIASLDFEINNLDEMQKRITVRKRAAQRKHDNLKSYLLGEMRQLGLTTIKDSAVVMSVKNNPAKVVVIAEDDVPDKFKVTKTEVSISKTAISTALKAGEDVPGVLLESSQRLDIK